MTVAAPAGTEGWIRHVLTVHWGARWGAGALAPLTVGGAEPLTHTAGLWHVTGPEADHVLKVQLTAEAVRAERFAPLKERVLTHCRRQGVPVLPVVPTADGSPGARHDGVVCELSPRSDGTVSTGSRAHASAIVRTGLDLRQALDGLPPGTADELATIHLPRLVEEEDWSAALDDAERRLLPKAVAGHDRWHRAAAAVLHELASAAPLLRRDPVGGASGSAARPAVVHGDLHLQHFLLAPQAPARVVAVLDFDNLHVQDRLLDLAWLADTAVHACGDDLAGARRVVADFVAAGRRRGLLGPGDAERLMPLLLAHSLPVIVDIAKDILDRGILAAQWLDYFALLSPARRRTVHRLLTCADGR
ncbi:phosphotransferase family protein [Streptomyces sp. NPDC059122]|uniref:phosphotransferase family protein n=1 Tax=Streptomyces sp. NPDC059122 TaxID=3346732 RepID=UPI0036B0650D